MRTRGFSALLAVAAIVMTGCSTGEDPAPEPTTMVPTSDAPSPEPSEPSETESPSPSPEPFDPHNVDLANAEWEAGDLWYEPETLELVDGAATGERGAPGRYVTTVEDALYVDLDGDDLEDVVAPLTFEADVSEGTYEWVSTTWFAWLNDGEKLTQYPFPLAAAGDCSTQVHQITPAPGGVGVVVNEAQMAWQSACADGATIEVTRTVRIDHDETGEPWLVQTDPFDSWGGACLPMLGPGDDPGEVNVAPGLEAASPDVPPVIVETGIEEAGGSWMSEAVDGWDFVTYLQDQDPDFVSYCGWTPER
ncbi:hypothetical protein [Ruania rhizosphaerae]|uniref:hypothetical protein n=1 Tax=Ruania rhizosphaerae TaxID=1840413 RepID=UPI00135B8361|nr:hypothetical protein [Ruania rhizosphaerae]